MKTLLTFLISFLMLAAASAKTTAKVKKGSAMATQEVSYLAGGCFWGVEDLLRKIPGVIETEVGYMGGESNTANYNLVKTGTTNHAETVKITFDPAKLKFEDLLLYFFKIHDPTTRNQQGNDKGTQYRSVIFYTSNEQKDTAERVIVRVDKSGAWKNPVVTQVIPAGQFGKGEDYHQDYLVKNPGGYTCHWERKIQF